MLERMEKLRLIACFTVGYDGVDLDWARARGVAVTHDGDANAETVADHALGLILAHRRLIGLGDRAVRTGWGKAGGETMTACKCGRGNRIGARARIRIGRAKPHQPESQ